MPNTDFYPDLYPYSLEELYRLGVRLTVGLVDDKGFMELKPKEDGSLATLPADVPVEFGIMIRAERTTNRVITAASVYGRKRIIDGKGDYTATEPEATFVKLIRNRETQLTGAKGQKLLSTKHEGNNTRLVIVENNLFKMFELAVPTRIYDEEARYFLTVQKLYQGRLYNLGGYPYIPSSDYPGYLRWERLQEFLPHVIDIEKLPILDRPLETAEELQVLLSGQQLNNGKVNGLSDNEAVVEYFCLASGLGLAHTAYGPGRIHWTEIESNDPFVHLSQGQRITFEKVGFLEDGSLELQQIYPIRQALRPESQHRGAHDKLMPVGAEG